MSKSYEIQVEVADSFIKNSNSEKILGVNIYKKFSFDEYVKNISHKANSKLRVLARASPYMDIRTWKLFLIALFKTQLNHCPLIWMLHINCNNNKLK